MNKWLNCSELGKTKEEEFAQLLLTKFGGTIRKANRKEDMFKHIDLFWNYQDKIITYDVKSAKKNNRKDNDVNYSINWIELQNVRGNPGWIYGKADYIAFECENDWIICRRIDIINMINQKVIFKEIQHSKELYTYYQRYGRKDIVVKVLTDDLRSISRKCIEKNI